MQSRTFRFPVSASSRVLCVSIVLALLAVYTHTLAASVTFEFVRVSDLLPEPERQIESGMSLARTRFPSDDD